MQQYLTAATEAARAAGDLIRRSLGKYETLHTKASAHDLVTDVDRACEEIVSRHLLGAFPGHAMLGEEGVTRGPARLERTANFSQVEYLWICDPIDGTTNFVHGIPCCTVAICLAHYGKPVLGVVCDPSRDELFTAVQGQGAFLNGQPMRVRTDQRLDDSLLATGFPTRWELREQNVAAMGRVSPHVRNIRNLGSAELHLAYVAAGRLTGFWENGLSPWDLAAGYVLVTEAGGTVTDLDGSPYTLAVSDIMATNGAIHGDLHLLVTGA